MNTEQKPDNPPLFFAWDPDRGDEPITTEVTLRDLFAAFALAGAISRDGEDISDAKQEARYAYAYADAMLAERATQATGREDA